MMTHILKRLRTSTALTPAGSSSSSTRGEEDAEGGAEDSHSHSHVPEEEGGALKTQAVRDLEEWGARRVYDRSLVRIKFPDGAMLTGTWCACVLFELAVSMCL